MEGGRDRMRRQARQQAGQQLTPLLDLLACDRDLHDPVTAGGPRPFWRRLVGADIDRELDSSTQMACQLRVRVGVGY